MTARSQCSVNHPGHHAGAHATRVNHEAHATRNQQGTRPTHVRPTEFGSVCGGRPGQRMEEQGTWASRARQRSEAGGGRTEDGGMWTAKTVKRTPQQPAHPQYANYWAPLTRKRHILPQPAQPRHSNHWAPRTQKRHQQEHRPQRPTESSDPTQHAKGRTGDRPGPRKETATRRNVTRGWGAGPPPLKRSPPPPPAPPVGSSFGQREGVLGKGAATPPHKTCPSVCCRGPAGSALPHVPLHARGTQPLGNGPCPTSMVCPKRTRAAPSRARPTPALHKRRRGANDRDLRRTAAGLWALGYRAPHPMCCTPPPPLQTARSRGGCT